MISEALAIDLFGTNAAAGRSFPRERPPGGSKADIYRVVGVVQTFRQHGEFAGPELAVSDNYLFERVRIDDPTQPAPRNVVIKVRPGTTAEFEPRLLRDCSRSRATGHSKSSRSRRSARASGASRWSSTSSPGSWPAS
ncbi:MAG: hypothetical protein ACE148_15105 [Vicinamibacterales bacterium]